MADRMSATPASTALRVTKRLAVVLAMTRARVVLPVPGGPERMYRGELVLLDRPPEKAAGPDDVLLAGELVEAPRPHPRGEGLRDALGGAHAAGSPAEEKRLVVRSCLLGRPSRPSEQPWSPVLAYRP